MSREYHVSAVGAEFELQRSGFILKSHRGWAGILLVLLVFGSSAVHRAQAQSGPPGSGWVLTFDEEFQGNTIDTGKWRVYDGYPQYYGGVPGGSTALPSNVVVGNGVLQLLTQQGGPTGTTSGTIDTWHHYYQKYGWFEARIKQPPGYGMWTGFWLTTDVLWTDPSYHEIDFQWLGKRPSSMNLAHFTSYSGPMLWYDAPYDFSADFHTYAINWQPDSITCYIDGIERFRDTDNVPQNPMFLSIFSGTGGASTWSGPVDPSSLPNSMVVDYVRIYQGGGTTPPVPVPLPPSPAPLSPNGSVIYAGQGGSLTTSEGTWNFGTACTDGVNYYTQLNGVANGAAFQLQITNGKVYAYDKWDGTWWLWQNNTWVGTSAPAAPSPSLSPNGSVIYAGQGGSLTTSEGTWTFGTACTDGVNYYTQLNGVANGAAFQLQITNGNVYAYDKWDGTWWLWQNNTWAGTSAPAVPSLSLSPNGSVIYVGQGSSLTTSQGTWTFGSSFDGTNYPTQLNGVANGWAVQLQITNGNVYAHNQVGWYLWQNNAWVDAGTTAP